MNICIVVANEIRRSNLPISWPRTPSIVAVSYASNIPQNDISCLGLHITVSGVGGPYRGYRVVAGLPKGFPWYCQVLFLVITDCQSHSCFSSGFCTLLWWTFFPCYPNSWRLHGIITVVSLSMNLQCVFLWDTSEARAAEREPRQKKRRAYCFLCIP